VSIGAGSDADRHAKLLIHLAMEGALFDAYSQLGRDRPPSCSVPIPFPRDHSGIAFPISTFSVSDRASITTVALVPGMISNRGANWTIRPASVPSTDTSPLTVAAPEAISPSNGVTPIITPSKSCRFSVIASGKGLCRCHCRITLRFG